MEHQINRLTIALVDKCQKQPPAVVIGAAFNLAQSALNTIQNRSVLAAVAATLRAQAEQIDAMLGAKQ